MAIDLNPPRRVKAERLRPFSWSGKNRQPGADAPISLHPPIPWLLAMPARAVASLVFFSALITTACGSHTSTPDIKQNPHPVKRYEITMTIEGAPGPFDSVNGYAMYQVLNDECVPLTPGSGARPAPDKSVLLAFTQVGNVYKGTLYIDQLLDEDYYGKGVCHWTLTGAGALTNLRKIIFSPSLSLDNIKAQKQSVTYFANASYRDLKESGSDTGTIKTEYVTEHPNEFFSIAIVARVDTP